jgi:hypothetical protein
MPAWNPAPIGSAEELRQFVVECLQLVVLYAEHAQALAYRGMDEELVATTRKLFASVNSVGATVSDLSGRTCSGT